MVTDHLEKVYNIIKELGGEATVKQIKEKVQEKYPEDKSLIINIRNRALYKLRYWKYIEESGPATWKIVKEFEG